MAEASQIKGIDTKSRQIAEIVGGNAKENENYDHKMTYALMFNRIFTFLLNFN